jgi:hypothetical protein
MPGFVGKKPQPLQEAAIPEWYLPPLAVPHARHDDSAAPVQRSAAQIRSLWLAACAIVVALVTIAGYALLQLSGYNPIVPH